MPTEFTIAYRATEEPQIDPSEIPLVLQRLNGDRPRKELPRFVGVVLGFPCTISGETEDEITDNARNKIRSMIKVRRARGLSDQPTNESEGELTAPGDMRRKTINV